MKPPPPLVLFDTLKDYLKALDQETRTQFEGEIVALYEQGLPPVVSVRALATLFGYRPQFVGSMCQSPERYYRTFSIRKGKKTRIIHSPKVGLKVIQKWISFHLAKQINLEDNIVGFVPGRSTFDGAKRHCLSDWVFSTDIIDFFPSTSLSTVSRSLELIGYPARGSQIIGQLSCLRGFLSQGSPLSPVLSNIAFSSSDTLIAELARKNGFEYGRYADDITLSGTGSPPEGISELVGGIIQAGRWKISPEKTRLVVRPNRMKVYGLIVNGAIPRLTKGYRKRLRAITHLLEAGKVPLDRIDEAHGHLSYASSIDVRAMQSISPPIDS